MRDICDGQWIKQHVVFTAHPNALQFLIYYDDIEVANPLGAKAGAHKLGKLIHDTYCNVQLKLFYYIIYNYYSEGVFYYELCNIRPVFRSSLRAIQLIAVARTADIRSYGCDALLQPFIKQVNLLGRVNFSKPGVSAYNTIFSLQDEGYCLQLHDEEMVVHGAVVSMCGDTPGSNYIGGFKEGVGFSLRKCRVCLATISDMGSKVCSWVQ